VARMRITVTDNGPYAVTGEVPLVVAEIVVNDEGESVAWRETRRIETGPRYDLCRCGHSGDKPFCDGSHYDADFVGTETAGHAAYDEVAACTDCAGVRLKDVRELCAEARFCDRAGGLWNLVLKRDEPGVEELIKEEAMLCPSGRYVACDPETDAPFEFDYEPSIALVEDPQLGVSGPLWVRGGIPIIDGHGEAYEVRNRVTLCRCGRSGNKPFCDGSHMPEAGGGKT